MKNKEEIKRHPQAEEKAIDADETKKKPTFEVIANSKEEKRLIEEKKANERTVEELKQKNIELEKEAVRFDNLASTLSYEPFVNLKMIVSSAVQDNARKQDIKECKKQLKNYEAINSMENLLRGYRQDAENCRSTIELNKKDIDDYEIKIAEIEEKLKNFQIKLPV